MHMYFYSIIVVRINIIILFSCFLMVVVSWTVRARGPMQGENA